MKVYVLWSDQTGPIVAYGDSTKAENHQRTMLGVELKVCESDFDSIAAGEMVYLVWAREIGPAMVFVEASSAHAVAMQAPGWMVGDCIIRNELPDIVSDDIQSDFDGDDDTPEIANEEHDEIDVRIVDIDDA